MLPKCLLSRFSRSDNGSALVILLTEFDPQTYSNLVQRCFEDCSSDFTTKSLSAREEGCIMRCVDKSMKATERLGMRFQEKNAEMMQQGGLPGAGMQ